MAQRSEDGIGITSVMSKRLKRAKAVWTRSAISIQASSRVIGLRQQAGHTEAPEPERKKSLNTPLNPKGRPHTDILATTQLRSFSANHQLAETSHSANTPTKQILWR